MEEASSYFHFDRIWKDQSNIIGIRSKTPSLRYIVMKYISQFFLNQHVELWFLTGFLWPIQWISEREMIQISNFISSMQVQTQRVTIIIGWFSETAHSSSFLLENSVILVRALFHIVVKLDQFKTYRLTIIFWTKGLFFI